MRTLVTLITLCTLAGGARASMQEAMEWKFKVLLDDREIGFHDFKVSKDAERTLVDIDARFNVKILFINAYQYQHRNAEIWDNNCLTEIDSSTNDNGQRLSVKGSVEGDAFKVRSSETDVELDACPMSFAYWNPSLLNASELLNSQTGELQDVVVTSRGEDSVRYGDQDIPALRYDLAVEGQEISLWYDARDYRWLALETLAKGNRLLRYEPKQLPHALYSLAETNKAEI